MKKTISFILLTLLVLSGCSSKEDKINDMIKSDMKVCLYDFKSYEPTKTQIDSAFYNIHGDNHVREKVSKFIKLKEEYEELDKETEYLAMNTMAYSGLSSAPAVSMYNKYSKDLSENQKKLKTLESNIEKIKNEIISIHDKAPRKKFIGWGVVHYFKCNTQEGLPYIGQIAYIVDKDIKKILFKIDMTDSDEIEIDETIDKIINGD